VINFLDTAHLYANLKVSKMDKKKINTAHLYANLKVSKMDKKKINTAQLHANLKINMKIGQPYRLNAIVPTGAKRHKKTLA
jgi:hypothetical protein